MAVGRNYIGSASAFRAGYEGVAVESYYRARQVRVDVNRTRWAQTMKAVTEVGSLQGGPSSWTSSPSWLSRLMARMGG